MHISSDRFYANLVQVKKYATYLSSFWLCSYPAQVQCYNNPLHTLWHGWRWTAISCACFMDLLGGVHAGLELCEE